MNKKSMKHNFKKYLFVSSLRRSDILAIEKIIKKRLHPGDLYIELGKPRYMEMVRYSENTLSSAKFLTKGSYKIRRFRLVSKSPSVQLELKWFRVLILVNRVSASNEKLEQIDETTREIIAYIRGRGK